MKLIIMTKPTFFVEEDKILTTLFEEGLENLHLYKPGSEPMYSERLLTLLSDEYYKKITVHDHFYLREEYGLKGIHLNTAEAELPYGYKGHVSRTCHAVAELREAKKRSVYVFLKTVYDSQSNPADRKVYAMGGMTLDNVKAMRDLGFGGVVVCGDLWNRFNIHHGQDYKELISHFVKLQKAVRG